MPMLFQDQSSRLLGIARSLVHSQLSSTHLETSQAATPTVDLVSCNDIVPRRSMGSVASQCSGCLGHCQRARSISLPSPFSDKMETADSRDKRFPGSAAMNIIFCSDDLDRRQARRSIRSRGCRRGTCSADSISSSTSMRWSTTAMLTRLFGGCPSRLNQASPCIVAGCSSHPSTPAYTRRLPPRACASSTILPPTVHCHHLPESYSVIEEWTTTLRLAEDRGRREHGPHHGICLQPFGATPLVLKDFVKSRKHEWDEACYIPSASDRSFR